MNDIDETFILLKYGNTPPEASYYGTLGYMALPYDFLTNLDDDFLNFTRYFGRLTSTVGSAPWLKSPVNRIRYLKDRLRYERHKQGLSNCDTSKDQVE